MFGDIAFVSSHAAGDFQKAVDGFSFRRFEHIEISRKINDAPQRRCIGELATGSEQLASFCDAREEHSLRKISAVQPFDPDMIRACDLTAMNAAQLSELDEAFGDSSRT